jgi:hypothetical protein
MKRSFAAMLTVTLALTTVPLDSTFGAADGPRFEPGAPGIGDPYYPNDGNGGYDVAHYDLDLTYDPATDVLSGTATITASATQNLSSFNLDFVGLNVRDVRVDDRRASFARSDGELTITPRRGIARRSRFTTVIRYDGIPEALFDFGGVSGFIATDDGAVVAGQPHVAATWFPVNDHPLDAASFTFNITVPAGTEAVANGVLERTRTRRGWTTYRWNAKEPMASYLATMDIGQFDLKSYVVDDIKYWDAVDPDLYIPPVLVRTGTQVLGSGDPNVSDASFKRFSRTISVPAEGGTLSFWVARDTEPTWDFFFVEAHTNDTDWTTLPAAGVTSTDTGNSCPDWLSIHPALTAYQTDNGDGTCSPTGTSGSWNAVTGIDPGWTQWTVDLGGYAGGDVEVSLSYASDCCVQGQGVAIDDVDAPGTDADTSFENDGNTFDGWTVPGAPAGSPGNGADWSAITQDQLPKPQGAQIDASFARQPEIIGFLASTFGRYPFSAAGGIVDDVTGLGFALETQTRPIYSRDFFNNPFGADSVVVHEITHQWFGDNLRLGRWQDIWLNEGFATYAEWLWADHEGFFTPQDNFDFFMGVIPADDPFWSLVIGDPGPDHLFDSPVYNRGALTLHALRMAIGDDAFFTVLRTWASEQARQAVTTPQFIDLAERISGQDLDALFDEWLYTGSKPGAGAPAVAAFGFRSAGTVTTTVKSALKDFARR